MATNGAEYERLVQLIEQSINPGARVEHDVEMPILNSRIGAKTQCDVVITTGEFPRETITLVEVQDRDKKPKSNDFRGWRQKLDDTGAQHLICVSRKGFTESEIETARLSGNRIRLITLSELDSENIPLGFFELYFEFENFDFEPLSELEIVLSGKDRKRFGITQDAVDNLEADINEKVYSTDKQELVSIYDLCKRTAYPNFVEGSGTDSLRFIANKNHIFRLIDGHFLKTELKFDFEWFYERVNLPASILAYEQDEFGTLAWLVKAGYQSRNGWVGFEAPVTALKDQSGYRMGGFEVKAPSKQLFEWGLYIAKPVQGADSSDE